jgi:hypothetical protein
MNKYEIMLEEFIDVFTNSNLLDKFDKELRLLVELVERATPKDMVVKEEGTGKHKGITWLSCKCGGEYMTEDFKFCPNCGQLIDWSE